jgi:hypothetical protein
VALWLGDSFGFGQAVDFEDTWIGRLDRDPARLFHHVDAGVDDYGPNQYAAVLDDLLQQGLPVRMVLVATFLGNDFHDTIWDKDLPVHDGVLGNRGGLKSVLQRHSHLYRAVSRSFHRLFGGPPRQAQALDDLANPAQWHAGILAEAQTRYRQAFAHIAAACRAKGVPLRVVVLPYAKMVEELKARGPAPSPEVSDARAPLYRATTILRDLGISFVDVSAELARIPTARAYYHFDQHFTPLAHEIVARTVREAMPELSGP